MFLYAFHQNFIETRHRNKNPFFLHTLSIYKYATRVLSFMRAILITNKMNRLLNITSRFSFYQIPLRNFYTENYFHRKSSAELLYLFNYFTAILLHISDILFYSRNKYLLMENNMIKSILLSLVCFENKLLRSFLSLYIHIGRYIC